MGDISNYLVLNEERNAIDYLNHAFLFLSEVEKDKNMISLKWFIIAFHGALYSFMLLALQRVDADQIYQKEKLDMEQKERTPMEEFEAKHVIGFNDAYKFLKKEKNMANVPYKSTEMQEECVKKLNNELRNQLIHFKSMTLGYDAWYPANVCLPLVDILEFCIARVSTAEYEEYGVKMTLNKILVLLQKHKVQSN